LVILLRVFFAIEIASLNISRFFTPFEFSHRWTKLYSIGLGVSLTLELVHIGEIVPTFISRDIEHIIEDFISDIPIFVAGR
jgi:hypothetical protein